MDNRFNMGTTKTFSLPAKLSLILVSTALIPLMLFGLIALYQTKQGTTITVRERNTHVSRQAAERITQYINNSTIVINSIAENLTNSDEFAQRNLLLFRSISNRFKQFNTMSVYNTDGTIKINPSMEAQAHQLAQDLIKKVLISNDNELSSFYIRKLDLSPSILVATPIIRLQKLESVLITELNLMHMWYLVDEIQIGEKGVLHVISDRNCVIATGDGRRKKDVFKEKIYEENLDQSTLYQNNGQIFLNQFNEDVLAVGTDMTVLPWKVIMEQPLDEAYALSNSIRLELFISMIIFLIAALLVGTLSGRSQLIKPIRTLALATDELAKGNLDYRVKIETGDEFEQLGDAFNDMALRLKDLQQRLIQEERHAMFGRIASGLAHDLKHPIQAIETSSRLMDQLYHDAEFRKTFHTTVEREFSKINDFLFNLHNLTHDMPYHPRPININTVIREAAETFKAIAEERQITLQLATPDENIMVHADKKILNRAFSNLISNAIQATANHGKVILSTKRYQDYVEISVKDTGRGIPTKRLAKLFEDFVTSKGRGLGLGLAITKKVIEQHGGKISVSSRVGEGTSFTIKLDLANLN